ncbi:MAG: hypothetical protein DBP01_15380 [gamma proteobacterium symbiont of Ctena orbiculata]|nr:MAG: hypothetical protein DBP01_15380 [gamma proteobacterium symbiont of Ctena orbiculata]
MESKDTIWQKIGLVLIGTIIGAATSYASSYGLWYAQQDHNYKEGVKKSREELIVEAAELFAYAPRIDGIVKAALLQSVVGQTIQNVCLSAKMRGETIESCNKDIDYSVINEFGDNVFIYNARFEKLRNLTNLYFCKKTKLQFERLGKSKAWWEIKSNEVNDILATMHSEYNCKL